MGGRMCGPGGSRVPRGPFSTWWPPNQMNNQPLLHERFKVSVMDWIVFPPNSDVEVLPLLRLRNVTVFGDRVFRQVIKGEQGHMGWP